MITLVIVNKSFVFADKPAGIPTHSVDQGHKGFAEHLEEKLGFKLYVVHRLDKTTSGAMVFATSPDSAATLTRAFQNHEVRKRYLFVTDRESGHDNDEFWASSMIEKRGNIYVNKACEKSLANAETHFRRIKRSPFLELWEAFPKTGKTHQIRLHAQQLNLNILGDTLYGGKSFPHLCLHAESLEIPSSDGSSEKFVSAPPRFFERLGLAKDEELSLILSSIDRRLRWFSFFEKPNQCLRLMHDESPNYRLDLFGERMWLYWYKETDPTEADLTRWKFVSDHIGRPLLIRKMKNRGVDPKMSSTWTLGPFENNWTAKENDLNFEFRPDQGLSPGLFLDQRENRQAVQALSSGKRVLNLFSYTCGFSLAAAKGGASEVASVDVSSAFLDWGKRNFERNDLDPKQYEFFAADTFFFLDRAAKRKRKFDLIILDPPSFSRSKDMVFSLEKDFAKLVQACERALAPQGKMLVSTNFETWTEDDLHKRIKKALPHCKIESARQGLDFELNSSTALMKCFWVSL
jgi:23S rRNA (cytosine1962-C5)-methyltransferase